jgi:hypothetical protein
LYCALVLLVVPAVAQLSGTSASASPNHTLIAPSDLKWQPLIPGAEMAVLWGDPGKPGDQYAMRIRSTQQVKVPPHWHPQDEHITILEGTFRFGMGEKFDAAALSNASPGAYVVIPREMRHFGVLDTGGVMQISGVGPFVINYVNPADDPNRSATAPPK